MYATRAQASKGEDPEGGQRFSTGKYENGTQLIIHSLSVSSLKLPASLTHGEIAPKASTQRDPQGYYPISTGEPTGVALSKHRHGETLGAIT